MRTALGAATAAVTAVAFAPAVAIVSAVVAAGPVAAATATVPRPDHVVIVVEENRAASQILGNPDAPYINSLAAQNANFTQSYAETHPSQPNYIALFSGSQNGIVDDSCPHTITAPSLGEQLITEGLGFAGYSEDLPGVGYTGCSSGGYARKHAPWVNFPAVPASANQPLTAFPTDFSTLPAVSFVIPNLSNDMHDGSIAQGDAWLQAHLGGYVAWAKTHNSLFLLTFDEDDGTENNRIATVLAGERVQPGTYDERIDHYSVLRTLQDGYGLAPIANSGTASPILDVWTPDPGAPAARFTLTCSGQNCTFDGSGSSDPDGTVASYQWDFGDGATGSGSTVTHQFAAGTYSVRLTVTDDTGASSSVTHPVTVAVSSAAAFATDTFARTVSGGWGSADLGGSWAVIGSTANTSVSGGAGRLRLPAGTTSGAVLTAVRSSDTDLGLELATDKVPGGNGAYLSVIGRRLTGGEYRGQVRIAANGSVTIAITRVSAGVETALAAPVTVTGLTYTAGTVLDTRLQVTGTNPTTLRARVWPAGTTEPTGWQRTASDSTAALQATGSIGVSAYLSGSATNAPVTVAVSALSARPTAGSTGQPPTASFTTACDLATCAFDAAASADPDGTIASYAWDFGDGATATGSTATHTFAAAGLHTVALLVTDSSGATAMRSEYVTTGEVPNAPPTASFTATVTGLSVAFDASASSDSDGTIVSYAWDFGDGATATGRTATHTYGTDGSYLVTLTVTDDDDAAATATRTVAVAAPTSLASDTYTRTVAAGSWGSADVGGAWSLVLGASRCSVDGSAGRMSLPSAGAAAIAVLPSVNRADVTVQVDSSVSAVATGSGTHVLLLARRAGTSDYRLKVKYLTGGVLHLAVSRVVSNAETALREVVVPGTYAAGDRFRVEFAVSGTAPTTLLGTVWRVGTAQPATPQIALTDGTAALQAAGAIGLSAALSGTSTAPTVAGFDNLLVN